MNKIYPGFILLVVLLNGVFMYQPSVVEANTSAGWYSFRSELIGGSGCSGSQTRMDVRLKEYGSFADINPQGVRIKIQVWDMQNILQPSFITETAWRSGSALSHSICYNPQTQGIRPIIEVNESTSQYLPHRDELIVGVLSNLERNQHLRGYVHLMRQNNPEQHTVAAQSPVESIINQDPPYTVGVRTFPNQYNQLSNASLSGLADTMLYVWRDVDAIWSRYVVPTSGQQNSSRQVSPRNLQNDGYYLWTVSHSLSSVVTLGGPGQGFWVNYNDSITSGTTHPYSNFLLDRTGPVSSVQVQKLQPATSQQGETVRITNTVRDSLSGLARTEVFVSSPSTGNVRVANQQFTVGSGIVGGPKNTQNVAVELQLPPGNTYQIYATTRDAAGNITSSNQVNHTVDALPDPDASGSVEASNCEVPIGQSSCTTNVEWESSFASSPRVEVGGSVLSSSPSGQQSTDINLGSTQVRLFDGTTELDTSTAVATCVEGSQPENGVCEEEIIISNPGLILTAQPSIVRHGESVTLTYDMDEPNDLSCTIQGPNVNPDGSNPSILTFTVDASSLPGQLEIANRRNASSYLFYCDITASDGSVSRFEAPEVRVEVIPTVIEL